MRQNGHEKWWKNGGNIRIFDRHYVKSFLNTDTE